MWRLQNCRKSYNSTAYISAHSFDTHIHKSPSKWLLKLIKKWQIKPKVWIERGKKLCWSPMGTKEQWGFSFPGSNQVVISLEALFLDTSEKHQYYTHWSAKEKREHFIWCFSILELYLTLLWHAAGLLLAKVAVHCFILIDKRWTVSCDFQSGCWFPVK